MTENLCHANYIDCGYDRDTSSRRNPCVCRQKETSLPGHDRTIDRCYARGKCFPFLPAWPKEKAGEGQRFQMLSFTTEKGRVSPQGRGLYLAKRT